MTAVITNGDLLGQELVGWHRERCGKSEEVHRVSAPKSLAARLHQRQPVKSGPPSPR